MKRIGNNIAEFWKRAGKCKRKYFSRIQHFTVLDLLLRMADLFLRSKINSIAFLVQWFHYLLIFSWLICFCFPRFMWFICVMIGLITSIIIIFSLWEKFQTNPTITGLDTDFHTWNVAFPSITICQETPGNESSIDEFIE